MGKTTTYVWTHKVWVFWYQFFLFLFLFLEKLGTKKPHQVKKICNPINILGFFSSVQSSVQRTSTIPFHTIRSGMDPDASAASYPSQRLAR